MTQWTDINTFQWVDDNNYQWAITSTVDINGIGAFFNYADGVTTVWADDTTLYFGTNSSGVKYILKSNITIDTDEPISLEKYVRDYTEFDLTSPAIKYIHGYENCMVVCTTSGVDAIKHNPQGYRSYTTVSGAQKCFMTSKSFYYTTSGTQWAVNRVDTCLTDWTAPDHFYITGSGILAPDISINDIYVTEGTALDGVSNTLFLASSSGVYCIDESTLEYVIYYKEL